MRYEGVTRLVRSMPLGRYWSIASLIDDGVIMASGVHSMGEAELPHTELVVSMHALGLSLVNDEKREEIAYISISK